MIQENNPKNFLKTIDVSLDVGVIERVTGCKEITLIAEYDKLTYSFETNKSYEFMFAEFYNYFRGRLIAGDERRIVLKYKLDTEITTYLLV